MLVYAGTGKQLGDITGFGEACGVAVEPVDRGRLRRRLRRRQESGASAPTSGRPGGHQRRLHDHRHPDRTRIQSVPGRRRHRRQRLRLALLERPASSGLRRRGLRAGLADQAKGPKSASREAFRPAPPCTPTRANELYVDTGSRIVVLDSSRQLAEGIRLGQRLAASAGSRSTATSKHAYAVERLEHRRVRARTGRLRTDRRPGGRPRGERQRGAPLERLPDDRRTATSRCSAPRSRSAESYDNGGFRMVYRYDAVGDAARLRLVPADRRRCRPRTPRCRPTVWGSPTTGGSSSTRATSWSCATPNGKEDAYEWKNGVHLADLDRVQRLPVEPAHRHRRRQRRLLLHPRDARRQRPQRRRR